MCVYVHMEYMRFLYVEQCVPEHLAQVLEERVNEVNNGLKYGYMQLLPVIEFGVTVEALF